MQGKYFQLVPFLVVLLYALVQVVRLLVVIAAIKTYRLPFTISFWYDLPLKVFVVEFPRA